LSTVASWCTRYRKCTTSCPCSRSSLASYRLDRITIPDAAGKELTTLYDCPRCIFFLVFCILATVWINITVLTQVVVFINDSGCNHRYLPVSIIQGICCTVPPLLHHRGTCLCFFPVNLFRCVYVSNTVQCSNSLQCNNPNRRVSVACLDDRRFPSTEYME